MGVAAGKLSGEAMWLSVVITMHTTLDPAMPHEILDLEADSHPCEMMSVQSYSSRRRLKELKWRQPGRTIK